MRKQLLGARRLTRFREYVWFVLVTTLLGAAAGGGSFGVPLLLVVAANWLAVGFAFMINDVEDAPDDALDPAKLNRNPVSSGDLSPRAARFFSYGAAVLAALLYASLGWRPFLWGVACLILAYIYSARWVRLKTIPGADLVSHALMLAGLQFLTAHATFGGGPPWQWAFPLAFVMSISVYGQLFNEVRDLDGDRKAGVRHTASVLGLRAAYWLMMVCVGAAAIAAVLTVWVGHLIPNWVLLVMVGLAILLSLPPLLNFRRSQSAIQTQGPFQKPLEAAGAISLAAWFAGPSAVALLGAMDPSIPSSWAGLFFQ
jgi:4-hydroxybenzoate polyprenyltransferase